MAKETFTRQAFARTAARAQAQGGAGAAAAEKVRSGKGIDPLVDPKAHGLIRYSRPRFEERDGRFVLAMGPPIAERTGLDTTGSMGTNVQRAFRLLPKSYDLLVAGKNSVLRRYDLQMGTDIFGDLLDERVLLRSQFEMGVKIAEQLDMMPPEGGGWGNDGEDPEFRLFAAAYLTNAVINRWGLKSYDFTLTDEPAHEWLTADNLVKVFGDTVFEKVAENGHEISKKAPPSNKRVIDDLLKIAHAFVLLVGDRSDASAYWPRVIDKSRIIKIPDVELFPQVKAAVIGLTEGTLTLQTVHAFLREEGELAEKDAAFVVRAVSGIPIGAQAALPNFGKLPKKGDIFRTKTDVWPIGHEFDTGDKEDSLPKKKVKWV